MLNIYLCYAVVLLSALKYGNPRQDIYPDRELVGYWMLQGDCLDRSGNNNHGINHGVDLVQGRFDGKTAFIEIPDSPVLDFGTGDFSMIAWVYTDKIVNDIIGDILDKYDPVARRGVSLSVNSCTGGTDRHVYFGIDNAQGADKWEDCGRPGSTGCYVPGSLSVFRGKLYAAGRNASDEKTRGHVYRYEGNRKWTDMGKVGDCTGAGPLIVHNGELYTAATRIEEGFDRSRIYRYNGLHNWTDCGEPGGNPALNCIASYGGKLFTGSGPKRPGIFTQYDTSRWIISKIFPVEGSDLCIHSMTVYNNKLYTGYPDVYSFDGRSWTNEVSPVMNSMIHISAMTVFRGTLCAGTGPEAKILSYSGNRDWQLLGSAGKMTGEITSLAVYNGKLYSGLYSEVCRFDDSAECTFLTKPAGISESGIASLTVFDGRLFAAIGDCFGTDYAKSDASGNIFCMEAGKMATFDMDLGPGWKQIAAVRKGGILQVFIDGILVKTTLPFNASLYDLSNASPFRIGTGQTDYFNGKISEVRIYKRALEETEIRKLLITSKIRIINYFSFR